MISIIIPVYNGQQHLERCVRSVLAQSYRELEVILVNDGSTDSTLDELEKIDVPFTLVSYSRNRGKGHALLQGFKKALECGFEYAITIDSDGQHFPEDIPLFIEAEEKNLQK